MLDGHEEARRLRAVEQPVIVRQCEVAIDRIAISSTPVVGSVTTTGRFTTAPVPRIATCG
jgi:hypothetical protein